MTEELTELQIMGSAQRLLIEAGLLSVSEAELLVTANVCCKISSDGSTRRFWRVAQADKTVCVIAAPGGRSAAELAEAGSAWKIGRHLHEKAVAVPELYGWDADTGVLLFEDLGDVRLHDILLKTDSPGDNAADRDHYQVALRQLAAMQLEGAVGFDPTWCWDSARYDVPLMLERESGYFLRAFWQGLLCRQENSGVGEELRDIAENAGQALPNFFLHRDFQSRNIMIKEGRLRFIDFQAGRFGPLGYDVASLLIDPYATLSPQLQEELLVYYVSIIAGLRPGIEKDFFKHYSFLAVQRNLQIIGAFAFLSKVRGKAFFADFIRPALLSLRNRLADRSFAEYHQVRTLVDQGIVALQGL